MSVLDPATALADDVGVGLEQAHHLFFRRHRLAVEDPAYRLAHNVPGQVPVVCDLRAPVIQPRLFAALDRRQGTIGVP